MLEAAPKAVPATKAAAVLHGNTRPQFLPPFWGCQLAMSICLSREDRTAASKKHPSPLQRGRRRKSKMPGRKSHTSQQPRGSLTVPRGCFSISFPASGLSGGFWANKKHPKSNDLRCFLSMPPTGVEPVLCLQKGILSPSCLPISPQRHKKSHRLFKRQLL